MTPTAVHFGAGNIGRGFLGQLYSQSGYETVFVDVDDAIVDALNARGGYDIQIVGARCETIAVRRVRAIHGRDGDAVTRAIGGCDIASVSVGVRALSHVAPALAAGIAARAAGSGRPLNVVVCENLLDAASTLREAVLAAVDGSVAAFVRERVGFVATVVSRMVPIVPDAVKARRRLYVAVEAYATLPVDATAFVGPVPAIEGFLPVADIGAHEERKLFCHNCGHALCAYAGHRRGIELIADAVADPEVRALVAGGLAETGEALIARHGFEPSEHQAHVADLLGRFGNRALGDTVYRVARDPIRKLGRTDRLVGAAELCLEHGVEPAHVIEGIRAAFAFDHPDDPEASRLRAIVSSGGVDAALRQVCGLEPGEPLYERIRKVMP